MLHDQKSDKKKIDIDTIDTTIQSSLREYFMQNSQYETLKNYDDERTKLNDTKTPKMNQDEGIHLLLEEVDSNNQRGFMAQINSIVPTKYFTTDPNYKKVMIYSQVYFQVQSVRIKDSQQTQRLKALKHFLDSYGKQQANEDEFMNLFAIPQVSNPTQHSLQKRQFEDDFSSEFKSQLKTFLFNSLPGRSQKTALASMTQAWLLFHKDKRNNDAKQKMINLLRQREELMTDNKQLRKQVADLSSREEWLKNKINEDYSKWSNLSKELLDIAVSILSQVGMTDSGQHQDQWQADMDSQLQRYSYFIDMMLEETGVQQADQQQDQDQPKPGFNMQSQNQPSSDKASSLQDRSDDTRDKYPASTIKRDEEDNLSAKRLVDIKRLQYSPLSAINQDRVKESIIYRSEKVSSLCSILQAISWRLEYTPRSSSKIQIEELADQDIFNLNDTSKQQVVFSSKLNISYSIPAILQILLYDYGLKVKQQAVRLVNTVASDSVGRSYMMSESIVYLLFDIISAETTETLLRQDALGALQKFSLRRQCQDLMLDLEVINWLVGSISKEANHLSDYSLEQSTALLMNLSLRTKGKDSCEKKGDEILNLLIKMIDHKNEQVRTQINGILYSVLSRDSMRHKARAKGLRQRLEDLMNNSEENFEVQYKQILNQISIETQENNDVRSEVDDNDSDQWEDDEDNDDDINIEDEDFSQFGIPTGEDALMKFFHANRPSNIQPRRIESNKTYNSSLKKTNHADPFRPKTPSLKNSFSQRKSTPNERRKIQNQTLSEKRSEPLDANVNMNTNNTMNLEENHLGDSLNINVQINLNNSNLSSNHNEGNSEAALNEQNIRNLQDQNNDDDEKLALNRQQLDNEVMQTFSSKHHSHQQDPINSDYEQEFTDTPNKNIENITLSNINQSNYEPRLICAWQAYDFYKKDFNLNPCDSDQGLCVTGKEWIEQRFESTVNLGQIQVQYNSDDFRPLKLTLNDKLLTENFASGDNGEWKDTDKCRCGRQGPQTLIEGSNLMKLQSKSNQSEGNFPHLFKFEVKEAMYSEITPSIEGFSLIFRQTYWKGQEGSLWQQGKLMVNDKDDKAAQYSVIKQLERYRREDGSFEFCLLYPRSGYEPIYWSQTSNPLIDDGDEVINYYPIDVPQYKLNSFSGLLNNNSEKQLLNCSSFPNQEDIFFQSIGTQEDQNGGMPGILEDVPVECVELQARVGGLNLERKLHKTGVNQPIPFERSFKIIPVMGLDIQGGDIHSEKTEDFLDAMKLAQKQVSGRNQCCVYQGHEGVTSIKNIAKASQIFLSEPSALIVADESIFQEGSKLVELSAWEVEGNTQKEVHVDTQDEAQEVSKQQVKSIQQVASWDGTLLKVFDLSVGNYFVKVSLDSILFLYRDNIDIENDQSYDKQTNDEKNSFNDRLSFMEDDRTHSVQKTEHELETMSNPNQNQVKSEAEEEFYNSKEDSTIELSNEKTKRDQNNEDIITDGFKPNDIGRIQTQEQDEPQIDEEVMDLPDDPEYENHTQDNQSIRETSGMGNDNTNEHRSFNENNDHLQMSPENLRQSAAEDELEDISQKEDIPEVNEKERSNEVTDLINEEYEQFKDENDDENNEVLNHSNTAKTDHQKSEDELNYKELKGDILNHNLVQDQDQDDKHFDAKGDEKFDESIKSRHSQKITKKESVQENVDEKTDEEIEEFKQDVQSQHRGESMKIESEKSKNQTQDVDDGKNVFDDDEFKN